MKTLISFTILLFSLLSLFFSVSCFKANDNIGHDGRCTGSAYCSACTSCSRCGHCGSGGTCGVCAGGSTKKSIYKIPSSNKKKSDNSKKSTSSKPNNSTTKKSSSEKPYNNTYSYENYYAAQQIVNIYKGPGFKFEVIEKIKQGSQVTEISKTGNWLKVIVKKTGTEGYVYFKDVKN